MVNAEEYLLLCYRYIELNPVRAGMVQDPSEYIWSSYRWHGLGEANALIKDHALYLGWVRKMSCGNRLIVRCSAHSSTMLRWPRYANRPSRGCLWGGERFREEVAAALGRRLGRGLRGRPEGRAAGGALPGQADFGF
jgi:putative transposase